MCTQCAAGEIRPAGDDASGPDTACTQKQCTCDIDNGTASGQRGPTRCRTRDVSLVTSMEELSPPTSIPTGSGDSPLPPPSPLLHSPDPDSRLSVPESPPPVAVEEGGEEVGPPDSLRKKWGGGPPTQSLAVCPSALPEHGEAEQLSLSFAVAPPPRREEVLTPSSSRTTLSQWDSSSSSSSSQAELRPPPDWPVVLGVRESGGGWGPRPMPLDRRAGTALSRRGIGCRLHFGNLKLGFFFFVM